MAKSRGTNALLVAGGLIGVGLLAGKKTGAVSGIGSVYENFHVLRVKYMGATNSRPAKVKI